MNYRIPDLLNRQIINAYIAFVFEGHIKCRPEAKPDAWPMATTDI
jgi:hypothetical protein